MSDYTYTSETKDTKEIVTKIGYLIGVPMNIMEDCFLEECEDVLTELKNNTDATRMRYLCKLRNALMNNFKNTDHAICNDLTNITNMSWFDQENIKWLENHGLSIVGYNKRANNYMADIQTYINQYITTCKALFYDYINWDYIRDLFYIANCTKKDVMINHFNNYQANITFYPFQIFIVWKHPENIGSLLMSDRKFLKNIYAWHNDTFTDISKYKDATDETKEIIYQFIENHNKTVMAVDCENSDPFKIYALLQSLNTEETEKISKIVLYDDTNTTNAWDWLSHFTDIPLEHVETERVKDNKSLVDATMIAMCCKEHYMNQTDAFLLMSSDSDFYALIKTLPTADFIVMYEYEKCSNILKQTLEKNGTHYVALDSFHGGSSELMKREILFHELTDLFPYILGQTPEKITEILYSRTKITSTAKEKEIFCNKYIKTLALKIGTDGKFTYEIQQ